MDKGIYELADGSNPYDTGILVVEATEKEKTLQLKIIEKNMRFSTYVDVLFGEKSNVTINKHRSPHALTCGSGWFVIYPNRMGKPLLFETKEGAE